MYEERETPDMAAMLLSSSSKVQSKAMGRDRNANRTLSERARSIYMTMTSRKQSQALQSHDSIR